MGNSNFEHETLYSHDDMCSSIASTSNSLTDLAAFYYSASDSVSITDLSESVYDYSSLEAKALSSQSCGLSESLPNLSQARVEWPSESLRARIIKEWTEGFLSSSVKEVISYLPASELQKTQEKLDKMVEQQRIFERKNLAFFNDYLKTTT